jgi:ASC-1-like (ASCH) protein
VLHAVCGARPLVVLRYTNAYMTHYSQVADSVYVQIKKGEKIIEPRLNDDDHKKVRLGDMLVIINRTTREEVVAKVVGVLRYPTFDALFAAFPARYFGVEDIADIRREVARWYHSAAEAEHGVLGLKLHVLSAQR